MHTETQNKNNMPPEGMAWNPEALPGKFILKPVYWLVPILMWTGLVLASYWHNASEINANIEEMAANKGRFVFAMIEDMRLWNARHGGVYVQRTKETPSNPYLIDPQKDVITDYGQELTKLNPAYMTRQIADVIRENSSTLIHITSLDPINPDNMSDSWETQALKQFEDNRREQYSFLQDSLQPLFRYMAPLMTKQACLGCHEHQGYSVGDVRGGISVSFDAYPFLNARDNQLATQRIAHLITWFLLCSLSLFALMGLRHHLGMLITAHEEQENIVERRTRDLREESRQRHMAQAQFRRFIDASAEGIIALDDQGMCTFANFKATSLFGYHSPQDIISKALDDICGHHAHDDSHDPIDILSAVQSGREIGSDNEFFRRTDGRAFPVEYLASPVYEEGRFIGAVLTFSDISRRKERESELLKLSTAVAQSPAATLITDRDGKIEYVNKRFLEVSGYSEAEVLGRTPAFLKSGYTPPDVYDSMWRNLKNGHHWHGELLNKKKDGSMFWEETLISPIKDKFGSITHFVSVKRDITGYKTEMDEAWRQANYDTLTRLPNRNLFEDRLENAVALAHREDRRLGLLFLDLDGFKEINDQYGHAAGDHVLKITAERLQTCLRHSDTAARLGGDEFVIIVQDAHSVDGIENVAKKIIGEVAANHEYNGAVFSVSVSIGIAVMPRDADSAKDLVRFADVAMYAAKQRGKNGFCHYEDFVATQPPSKSAQNLN